MRSQVQVLAGPPLFSQLRGLTRPGRWRSLLAWAAPGPRPPPLLSPGTSRSRRPGSPGRSQRAPIVVATDQPRSWSADAGKHDPDDLRSHTADGVHSARTLFLDRQAILARNRRVPGRPGDRTGLAARAPPTTTARSSPTSPLAQHGSRRLSGPALDRAAARAVRGYGRALRPSWPCGRPPRRSAPRCHLVRTPRTPTRNTRTPTRNAERPHPDRHWTPGHWTPDAWTSHARTLDAHTGHRTPDTWTLTEDADRVTKARQAFGHLGHHDEPTACWTPNRVPVGGSAWGLGHHNGSAVRRPASARDCRPHYQQLLGRSANGQAAPRRTALVCWIWMVRVEGNGTKEG